MRIRFLRHSLKYDRSGRSSGTAIIAFETSTEATRAKKQFDGILAKGNVFTLTLHITCGASGSVHSADRPMFCLIGQPMSIEFDSPPRQPRRSASVPALLNRIQKPPLLDRLSRDDVHVKTPAGPSVLSTTSYITSLLTLRHLQARGSGTHSISTRTRTRSPTSCWNASGTQKAQNGGGT